MLLLPGEWSLRPPKPMTEGLTSAVGLPLVACDRLGLGFPLCSPATGTRRYPWLEASFEPLITKDELSVKNVKEEMVEKTNFVIVNKLTIVVQFVIVVSSPIL